MEELIKEIKRLKEEKHAVILAHYYQRGEIQDIADNVGDSLAMARYAANLREAEIVVVCGVYFMAETAKLLCPDKKVLIPVEEAGCSLADSCDADKFEKFVKEHPDHTVVSYVNTSVGVKALTDVLVTSGNAKKIIDSFPVEQKIIFGPDRNLGGYINRMTGRNMLLWDGACHVHEFFKVDKVLELKEQYKGAKVLVHPECKKELADIADKVGSTAALLDYAKNDDANTFIVATEAGILHQMRKACKDKTFVYAAGERKNQCGYMKMVTLEKLRDCLLNETPEVTISADIAERAVKPIQRMLSLS